MKLMVEIPTSMVSKIDEVRGEMSRAAYLFNSLKIKLDKDRETLNESATQRGEQYEAEEGNNYNFQSIRVD